MFSPLRWWFVSFHFILLFLVVFPVQAARLELNPEAHPVFNWGALAILYMHILGGVVGLIAGVVASLARKGGALHRSAGKIFLLAMLACYTVGALVAPFLDEGQRPNFVAAVLALYLLLSGVGAARKKPYTAGPANIIGLLIALGIAGMGMLFMYMGSQSATGTVDGSPPQAFVVFILAGLLAAIGEVNLLIKKSLSESARLIRHLWRMCGSFFFASGSLFLGQAQLFPDAFNASPVPGLLAFFPIIILMIWAVKIGWRSKNKTRQLSLQY